MAAYGKSCLCCGETNLNFLTLDHKGGNGSGSKHRKEVGIRGVSMYRWIILNNYPELFQVMCFNCNLGRAVNDNVCPHRTPRMTIDDVQGAGL